jgi:hypothetical protein
VLRLRAQPPARSRSSGARRRFPPARRVARRSARRCHRRTAAAWRWQGGGHRDQPPNRRHATPLSQRRAATARSGLADRPC